MKKPILLLLILSLTSCKSIFLNKYLNNTGILNEKAELKILSNNNKNIVFIGMHHFGRKEFYDDVRFKVDSLQQKGYAVFFESVEPDETIDSLTNDIYKKKVRKLMGLNPDNYYDTLTNIIVGKHKYRGKYKLINQPKSSKLNVNMDNAIKADLSVNVLIDELENRTGEIILNDCDLETNSNSTEYKCSKVNRRVTKVFRREIVNDYRDRHLANLVSNSKANNILIIYGEFHFFGLYQELGEIDKNWKIIKF